MIEYELDFNSEDIGEIITMIRVQVLKMHSAPLAKSIGIQESVLLSSEDGRGPHGINVLKKIAEKYPRIDISINVRIKKG